MTYAKKKRIQELFFLLILMFSFTNQSHASSLAVISQKDIAHFFVVDEHIIHTGTDACVQKVTDGTSVFIIKQINDPSIDEQFLLINDVVASTIGCHLGISVNEVSFIPYGVASHLKIYPERAATLHSYVAGKDLESYFPACLSVGFTLQQRVTNLRSVWQQKYPLAHNQQGLTRTIIESMSINELLPCLCALDTFIGNSDRSLPNIFFDQLNDRFYGIDQAASFSKKLPSLTCDRIKELIMEGYFENCSAGIIDSLRIYRNVLQQLYEDNQPDTITQSMQQLIPYLAFHALDSAVVQDRVAYHSSVINHNYSSVLGLIKLLDLIVQ